MENKSPKNWVETKLDEVVLSKKGKKPKILNEVEFEGSVPYLDIKAFEKNEIRRYADVESSNLIIESEIGIVWDGARSGWVSKGKKGAVGSTIAIVKPINIDSDFLYRFLQSKFDYLNTNTRGTGIPHVDPKVLWNIDFPLPPLAEQQRIVAKLDDLFGHLDTLKTRLKSIPQILKNFRQAVLTQAVTGKLTEAWRVGKELDSYLKIIIKNRKEYYIKRIESAKINGDRKPKKLDETDFEFYNYESNVKMPKGWKLANLKNIADLLTDGEHATPRRTESGYYLLSARNVRDGFISLEKVDYVPEDEYLRIKKRCNPEFKDVLISCSGSVGRVSTVPKDLEFVMVRSAALVKLQSNKEISKFVELSLRSRVVQNQILTLQKSTAQANLFLGQIGKIVIPIPSKEEQTEIVKRVEHLFAKADTIEAQYQSLKTKIDSLPQAILAKAFEGELVEQLDTDGDAKELLEEILKLKAEEKKKPRKKSTKKSNIKISKKKIIKPNPEFPLYSVLLNYSKGLSEKELYKLSGLTQHLFLTQFDKELESGMIKYDVENKILVKVVSK
ncbi:restriction endonuclease subunit S [Cellulophaga sp. L1A9]|uniref:restriction endonuclease subunit S n=1 Tax=Cellulophaga sp. L1A9 TaxID=2686362 RepID=UPI00131AF444|nr:restriction endonuclease subunit S [Cellulophaga sp. L1A9]